MNKPVDPQNRGRTLLFEHIPNRFGPEGVLFLIFLNGEAFFYPIKETTRGDFEIHKNPKATLISNEATKKIGFPPRPDAKGFSNYQVHNVELEDKHLSRVHRFPFFINEFGILPPRKLQLSSNQRLLLVFGIHYRGQSCLVIYQLLEHGPHRLKEIFFDLTISYIDACFTPDSTGILAVPTKYPHLVFLINLPLLKDDPGRSNTIPYRNTSSSIHNSIQIARSPTIHFEPRTAGPICIFGPSIGAFGNPLAITHIESNEYSTSNKNQFYFITWNDDGYGEYCLWHVIKSISTPSSSSSSNFLFLFRCIPRLLHSVFDQAWLEDEETPKTYILQVRFNGESKPIGFLTLRENYGKSTLNGIGIQMVKLNDDYWNTPVHNYQSFINLISTSPQARVKKLSELTQSSTSSSSFLSNDLSQIYSWYKLLDESDKPFSFSMKWTKPLFVGSNPSVAVLIQGYGLFELVDNCFASKFQDLGKIDNFSSTASNFCQTSKYHRFWTSTEGKLYVLVVSPNSTQFTLPKKYEWADFVQEQSPDYWDLRMFGSKFGYFIKNLVSDNDCQANQLEQIYSSRRRKTDLNHTLGIVVDTLCDATQYVGMHLYRCWQCRRVLVKPLQCSKCKSVVYCSENCQRDHWPLHRVVCTEEGLFYPHRIIK